MKRGGMQTCRFESSSVCVIYRSQLSAVEFATFMAHNHANLLHHKHGNIFAFAEHPTVWMAVQKHTFSLYLFILIFAISRVSSSNGDVSGEVWWPFSPNCGSQLAPCDEKSDSIGEKKDSSSRLWTAAPSFDSSQFRLTKINSTLIKISSVL